jgi:hypothetical protein
VRAARVGADNGRALVAVPLTILDGTFCICDELGDMHGEATGFFAEEGRGPRGRARGVEAA